MAKKVYLGIFDKNAGEKETPLQRRCQNIFEANGAVVFKMHGDMYSRRGIPDLIACVPATEQAIKKMLENGWFKDHKIGLFVGLETKRVGKVGAKAQRIVGREIKNAGGIWFVIDDSDIVEAIVKTAKGEL